MLTALRAAIGELVHTAPSSVERASDLQHALGSDASLGWQVFRLATAPTPIAAAAFVPHPPSMTRVLRLARERGFSQDAAAKVGAAYAQFEDLIERHAGSRRTFDAMISSLEDAPAGQGDQRLRRHMYRGNAELWGYHCKTLYGVCITHQGGRPDLEHSAKIHGLIGLQQIRPAAPITVMRRTSRWLEHQGTGEGVPLVAGQTEIARLQLLEAFCSTPLPQLEATADSKGIRDTLRLEGLGRSSLATCFAMDMLRDMPAEVEDRGWSTIMMINVPCETFVADLLVPRGWTDPGAMGMSTLGNASDLHAMLANPYQFPLPIKEEVVYLGTSLDALHDPDVPRCPALIRTALSRLGWEKSEFDIYRCRVRYPILHTVITVWADAPKTPKPA